MTKSNLLISHFYVNFHAFDKKHVLIVYKIDILVNQQEHVVCHFCLLTAFRFLEKSWLGSGSWAC